MRWLRWGRKATRRDERHVDIDLRDKSNDAGVVIDIREAALAREALHAYPQSVSLLPGVCPMWDRGETWDSATQRSEVVSSSDWIEPPADDDAPRRRR